MASAPTAPEQLASAVTTKPSAPTPATRVESGPGSSSQSATLPPVTPSDPQPVVTASTASVTPTTSSTTTSSASSTSTSTTTSTTPPAPVVTEDPNRQQQPLVAQAQPILAVKTESGSSSSSSTSPSMSQPGGTQPPAIATYALRNTNTFFDEIDESASRSTYKKSGTAAMSGSETITLLSPLRSKLIKMFYLHLGKVENPSISLSYPHLKDLKGTERELYARNCHDFILALCDQTVQPTLPSVSGFNTHDLVKRTANILLVYMRKHYTLPPHNEQNEVKWPASKNIILDNPPINIEKILIEKSKHACAYLIDMAFTSAGPSDTLTYDIKQQYEHLLNAYSNMTKHITQCSTPNKN